MPRASRLKKLVKKPKKTESERKFGQFITSEPPFALHPNCASICWNCVRFGGTLGGIFVTTIHVFVTTLFHHFGELTMTHSFAIPGMTCSGCERTVSRILSSIDGVTEVKTTLQPYSHVEITMSRHIEMDALNAELGKVAQGKYILLPDELPVLRKGELV
jgi:copper chaperone CopZ